MLRLPPSSFALVVPSLVIASALAACLGEDVPISGLPDVDAGKPDVETTDASPPVVPPPPADAGPACAAPLADCNGDGVCETSGLVAELIHGVLHTHPRPRTRHVRAASKLGGRLDGPFDSGIGGPGGWLLLDEPELHLGADVLVPDLAGWRRERMPELPDEPFLTLPPDWTCEVLSPSSADVDRAEEVPIYARENVAHVWLVDHLVKTLEVFLLDGATYRVAGVWRGDARVRVEPFDAIELELAALWTR